MSLIIVVGKKLYLKRSAGISLEILRESFHKNHIEYHITRVSGDARYFRDISMEVKGELEKLFSNYEIIPSSNDASRRFDEKSRVIELSAFYNLVIPLNDRPIEFDVNYLEITPRYAANLGIKNGEAPKIQPKDIIRISEM